MIMPKDVVKPMVVIYRLMARLRFQKEMGQLNPFINLIHSNYKVLNVGGGGNRVKLECNLICKMN